MVLQIHRPLFVAAACSLTIYFCHDHPNM